MKPNNILKSLAVLTVFTTLVLACSSEEAINTNNRTTTFQVNGVVYDITEGKNSGLMLEYIGDSNQFGGVSEYVILVMGQNSSNMLSAGVEFNLIVRQGNSPFGNYKIINSDEGKIPQADVDADLTTTLNAQGRAILDAPCTLYYSDDSIGFATAHYASEGLLLSQNEDGTIRVTYTGGAFKRFDNNTNLFVETVDVSLDVTGIPQEFLGN